MAERRIKNFNELATSENRKLALEIVEAGFSAINTREVIADSIKLENNVLFIKSEGFDLSKFKRIKVVGFGKASGDAALALEKILGDKIKEGAVIGLEKVSCSYIETFVGTHPRPSKINAIAGKKIYDIADQSNEDDLIIAIISGGGSALLCYSEDECEQGKKIYDSFLKCGQTIKQINAIRKHLSILKGGGLAKIAYPATTIGLIFSDIPGNDFQDVASGPTYKDKSTIHEAEIIINEHNLGHFNLIETPKESKYFEKVHNFIIVSNETAIRAMEQKSKEFGLKANVFSTELYDEMNKALEKMFSVSKNNTVVLAAGEPRISVSENSGKGGRNLHMGLEAIKNKVINENSVFISFASDGMDNSNVAGAVVDKNTLEKSKKLNLNIDDYLDRFDSYSFFQKTGDVITTGPTGANVSDLMILLNKK